MKITVDMLKELKACSEQVELFAETFPDGAEWNGENVIKSREAGLDLHWLILNLELPPSDDTRAVFLESPMLAGEYAYRIDKCPRDDTRAAACKYPCDATKYARYIDKCPRDDTRDAACKYPYNAFTYARYIDKCPRDDTRAAASWDEDIQKLYDEWEKSYNENNNRNINEN